MEAAHITSNSGTQRLTVSVGPKGILPFAGGLQAVCLFRICTNTIRRPQGDWRSRLEAGLSLVNETLG